jgi:hypothetical protein
MTSRRALEEIVSEFSVPFCEAVNVFDRHGKVLILWLHVVQLTLKHSPRFSIDPVVSVIPESLKNIVGASRFSTRT